MVVMPLVQEGRGLIITILVYPSSVNVLVGTSGEVVYLTSFGVIFWLK